MWSFFLTINSHHSRDWEWFLFVLPWPSSEISLVGVGGHLIYYLYNWWELGSLCVDWDLHHIPSIPPHPASTQMNKFGSLGLAKVLWTLASRPMSFINYLEVGIHSDIKFCRVQLEQWLVCNFREVWQRLLPRMLSQGTDITVCIYDWLTMTMMVLLGRFLPSFLPSFLLAPFLLYYSLSDGWRRNDLRDSRDRWRRLSPKTLRRPKYAAATLLHAC